MVNEKRCWSVRVLLLEFVFWFFRPLVRYKKIAPAFSIYRPSMDITAHPCATTH
jgi:hypothetical protein